MSLTKWPDCNRRIVRVLALWIGLPLLGICYGMLVSRIGFGIPCVFRLITGLKCPGCGVTHMALCLLRGDLSGAFYENPVVLMLLPIGLILAIRLTCRYLKTGSKRLTKWENLAVIAMIVLLVAFGIARNLKIFA